MLKDFVVSFFRILWKKSSNEQHLFEIEMFCNILNVFSFTFDKLNSSFLNESNHFSSKHSNVTETSVATSSGKHCVSYL